MEKTCTKCKESKDISMFHKNKTGKYGVASICKKCHSEKMSIHYKNNKEKYKENQKKWIKANKEKYLQTKRNDRNKNLEKYKEYERRSYQKHKEKRLESGRLLYQRTKESVLLRKSEYRKNNVEKYRFYCRTRQSKKIQAIPKWFDKEKVKEIYRNCPEGYHVDHIVPLISNIVC